MTFGSVVFFHCLQFSGSYSYMYFTRGAVPTVLIDFFFVFFFFFYIVLTDSNFGISSKLPYILNAAGRIS